MTTGATNISFIGIINIGFFHIISCLDQHTFVKHGALYSKVPLNALKYIHVQW